MTSRAATSSSPSRLDAPSPHKSESRRPIPKHKSRPPTFGYRSRAAGLRFLARQLIKVAPSDFDSGIGRRDSGSNWRPRWSNALRLLTILVHGHTLCRIWLLPFNNPHPDHRRHPRLDRHLENVTPATPPGATPHACPGRTASSAHPAAVLSPVPAGRPPTPSGPPQPKCPEHAAETAELPRARHTTRTIRWRRPRHALRAAPTPRGLRPLRRRDSSR
jgi:hypothetical protein